MPLTLSSPSRGKRKKAKGTGHGRNRFKDGLKGKRLLVEQLYGARALLIREGRARNGEPSTQPERNNLKTLLHFSLRTSSTLPQPQVSSALPKEVPGLHGRSAPANGGGVGAVPGTV